MQCALCGEPAEDPDQPAGAELCNSCAAYLDAKFAPVGDLLADPGLQAAIAADDDRDRAKFGGPITSGMLMTALNDCAYDGVVAHQLFDVNKLANIINGWLVPVQQ